MRLSTKSRYAVMALVDMAHQQLNDGKQGQPIAMTEIAQRQNLPLAYLEQLFVKLRRANLVQSTRGTHGGYALKHTPNEIRIIDIIQAVDTPLRATRCKPESVTGCQPGGSRCLTHDLWKELGTVVHLFLEKITLEDVCNKKHVGLGYLFFAPSSSQKEKPRPSEKAPTSFLSKEVHT